MSGKKRSGRKYWPHVDKDEIGSGGNVLVVPDFCWIGDVGFWLIKSW